MNKLIFILFLLLFVAGLFQCNPVPPSQGGNPSVKTFFCKPPGCAADVTDVLCDDNQVFKDARIANCTGPPPPNTVCQQGGRAFTSTKTSGDCEFEGKKGYIETKKCTDDTNDCAFTNATTAPPANRGVDKPAVYGGDDTNDCAFTNATTAPPADREHKYAVYGSVVPVLALLVLLAGGVFGIYVRRQNRERQSAGDCGVTVPLRET